MDKLDKKTQKAIYDLIGKKKKKLNQQNLLFFFLNIRTKIERIELME